MILRQHSVYLQGYNQQELSKFEGAMGEDILLIIKERARNSSITEDKIKCLFFITA